MQQVSQAVLERGERWVGADESEEREVLKRAAMLPETDRLLVEMVMRHASRRQIATLLRIPAGSVCRRMQRLSQRLHDPVVVALMHSRCPLAPELRQVGVERRLLGMTIAALAHKHQRSRQQVKKMLEYLNGWHQGLGAGRRLLKKVEGNNVHAGF